MLAREKFNIYKIVSNDTEYIVSNPKECLLRGEPMIVTDVLDSNGMVCSVAYWTKEDWETAEEVWYTAYVGNNTENANYIKLKALLAKYFPVFNNLYSSVPTKECADSSVAFAALISLLEYIDELTKEDTSYIIEILTSIATGE